MAEFAVAFLRSARKELESLDRRLRMRILSTIEDLETNPTPAGCKKLRDSENRWRIRVGDYRVVYSFTPQTKSVEIIAIRHRRDVYRQRL